MKKIVVTKDLQARCYTASSYVNEAPCAETVSLFGTHVLPTAFTLQAQIETVVSEIKKLNPNCLVIAK